MDKLQKLNKHDLLIFQKLSLLTKSLSLLFTLSAINFFHLNFKPYLNPLLDMPQHQLVLTIRGEFLIRNTFFHNIWPYIWPSQNHASTSFWSTFGDGVHFASSATRNFIDTLGNNTAELTGPWWSILINRTNTLILENRQQLC